MIATYPVSVDGQPPKPIKVETHTVTITPGSLCELDIDGQHELCVVVRVDAGISVLRLPNVKPQGPARPH